MAVAVYSREVVPGTPTRVSADGTFWAAEQDILDIVRDTGCEYSEAFEISHLMQQGSTMQQAAAVIAVAAVLEDSQAEAVAAVVDVLEGRG